MSLVSEDSEDEMEELCAQDIDRGQELAEEAASDEAWRSTALCSQLI